MLLVAIAVGGGLGAYARFRLTEGIHARAGTAFPWGTLAVNLSGSFALGIVLPLLAAYEPPAAVRAFLVVGCLSAFTTFSTFAYETVRLLDERGGVRAGAYVAGSLGLGLAAILLGLTVGEALL